MLNPEMCRGFVLSKRKSGIALLVAVLLVCGSCWSSACAFSCGLHAAQPVCASSSMNHAAMSGSCGHCDHAGSMNAGGQVVGSACGSMDCSHVVAVAVPSRDGAGTFADAPQQIVYAAVEAVRPLSVALRYRRMMPPRASSDLPSFLVSLRV
jgi:hypothetical protein